MRHSAEYVSLVEGATAIELVARCSDGFSQITIDYRFATAIHRLITDADYRAAALDMQAELFTARDAPEKLVAVIDEVKSWVQHKAISESRSATPTEDTPPISKPENPERD